MRVATSRLGKATVGTVYTKRLAAAGGSGAGYTWSLASGALPAGLCLNSATGMICGAPTAAGEFQFTVRVSDSLGASAQRRFSITISRPAE